MSFTDRASLFPVMILAIVATQASPPAPASETVPNLIKTGQVSRPGDFLVQFKGLTLGAPIEQVLEEAKTNSVDLQIKRAERKQDSAGQLSELEVHLRGTELETIVLKGGYKVTKTKFSFAGIDDIVCPATFVSVDGRLYLENILAMYAPADDAHDRYTKIANALELKYGKPDATFFPSLIWKKGDTTIFLTDKGVTFTNDRVKEAHEHRTAAKDVNDL